LKIAGIITDQSFFDRFVLPHIDNKLIQYVGNLSVAKLANLLQDTLALVALVEWNEPCSLSVLDALATGVPVIGSKMGSLPEVLYDSHLGMVVENVEEAVSRIGEMYTIDPIICRKYSRAKFSREVMAKHYLENYLKLA
jgi:glycosyltransferase involved in cell wall biosynthesis